MQSFSKTDAELKEMFKNIKDESHSKKYAFVIMKCDDTKVILDQAGDYVDGETDEEKVDRIKSNLSDAECR